MSTKVKRIFMYTSLGLTTLAFIAAGSAKLAGVEQMHLSFALMGLPAWFGYFIGASELAGAVAIWIKKLSIIAASGLLVIMAGATFFHVVYDSVANAIPAVILCAFLINIIINRVNDINALDSR